jgi:hypothetical protein
VQSSRLIVLPAGATATTALEWRLLSPLSWSLKKGGRRNGRRAGGAGGHYDNTQHVHNHEIQRPEPIAS